MKTTMLIGSLLGMTILYSANLSAATATTVPCQSGTLCVHEKMPLYKQGTLNIRKYIAEKQKIDIKTIIDTFCSPTSTAMVLKTLQLERNEQVLVPFLNSQNENEIIYEMMLLQKTSFTGGGTYISKIGPSVSSVVQKLKAGAVSKISLPTEKSYRKKHPLIVASVILNGKNGHTVAVNGFDGGYMKIFDPAGRIYNLSLNKVDGAYQYAPGSSPAYKYTKFSDLVSISSYMGPIAKATAVNSDPWAMFQN